MVAAKRQQLTRLGQTQLLLLAAALTMALHLA